MSSENFSITRNFSTVIPLKQYLHSTDRFSINNTTFKGVHLKLSTGNLYFELGWTTPSMSKRT